MVAAAWFSVTVLARSRFGRLRACGTFPCTVATTAVGPGPDGGDHTRLPASTAATTTAAVTAAVATLTRSAGRAADPGAAPQASPDLMARKARHAPARASRNVRNGG